MSFQYFQSNSENFPEKSSDGLLLIDSFLFNGEPIVQFRLQCMYQHVDKIYITEAWYTHSGVKKSQLFIDKYKLWFDPYLDKIKFLILDQFSKMTVEREIELKQMYIKTPDVISWHKENEQRNCAQKELKKLEEVKQPFIAIIADVDEIVNPRFLIYFKMLLAGKKHQMPQLSHVSQKLENTNNCKVNPEQNFTEECKLETLFAKIELEKYQISNVVGKKNQANQTCNLEYTNSAESGILQEFINEITDVLYIGMDFYYYNWNWRKPYIWTAPFLTRSSRHDLSVTRYKGYFSNAIKYYPCAGWHLSYFMEYDTMIQKIENLAHTENNRDDLKSRRWIETCIATGIDFLKRGPQEQCILSNQLFAINLLPRSHLYKCDSLIEYCVYPIRIGPNLIPSYIKCYRPRMQKYFVTNTFGNVVETGVNDDCNHIDRPNCSNFIPTYCDQLLKLAESMVKAKAGHSAYVIIDGISGNEFVWNQDKCHWMTHLIPISELIDLDKWLENLQSWNFHTPLVILDRLHKRDAFKYFDFHAWCELIQSASESFCVPVHQQIEKVISNFSGLEELEIPNGAEWSNLFKLIQNHASDSNSKKLIVDMELNRDQINRPCIVRTEFSESNFSGTNLSLNSVISRRFEENPVTNYMCPALYNELIERYKSCNILDMDYFEFLLQSLVFNQDSDAFLNPNLDNLLKTQFLPLIDSDKRLIVAYDDGVVNMVQKFLKSIKSDQTKLQLFQNQFKIYVVGCPFKSIQIDQEYKDFFESLLDSLFIPFNLYNNYSHKDLSFSDECGYEIAELILIQILYSRNLIEYVLPFETSDSFSIILKHILHCK